jgi:hypothetical protein
MRPHRSLEAGANVDQLAERLKRLSPDSPRQFGTLTAHEMLCHVGDSFQAVLGERKASPMDTWFSRTVVKWIALHTPLPWPAGVRTRPEVDPKKEGTKPAEFEADRQRVVDLLRRFASADTKYDRHPGFGEMSREEWLLWGYGHVDHHLRQFGL